MRLFLFLLSLGSLLCLAPPAQSQNDGRDKGNKIELLPSAELIMGDVIDGIPVRKVIGHAKFKHKDAILFCDSAFWFVSQNRLRAMGNVKIVQNDTLTITGNRLDYDGYTRIAKMRGDVVMTDPQMTLTTQFLDYNMSTKVAYYFNGGHIVDEKNTLDSKFGYYDAQSKTFIFQKDVHVVNPEYDLRSDTLRYNTATKMVYYEGPTYIDSKDGKLYAESGSYNTLNRQSYFQGRSTIETKEYRISGDTLWHNELMKLAIAKGHVEMISKKDSVTVYGRYGRYNGKTGISMVHGDPVMQNVDGGDTTWLMADTLYSYQDKKTDQTRVHAYHKVRIYRNDLQGACDSLVYDKGDSAIHLYENPMLWSGENQISGDTIALRFANGKISTLNLRLNSFIISIDTLGNYNQVKGRNMDAFFNDSTISHVTVDGNSESIYFVLTEENELMGMNKVICSDMFLRFDGSKLGTVNFIEKPDSKFVPVQLIEDPERRLNGFRWLPERRPVHASFLAAIRLSQPTRVLEKLVE